MVSKHQYVNISLMKSLKDIRHVHCIGIGGIGVSAIARMMIHEGKTVSGSDGGESKVTEGLRDIGIEVSIGHKKENIPVNTDLIVYTGAIPVDNEELLEAKERSIETLLYSQMLGLISKDKRTVAISGTHGKTTTTGMIAKILIDCGLSPTVIVGSLLKEYNSNFVSGDSDIFVVEACEYLRSFLELNPNITVITNIDADHLDYYKDLDDIKDTFSTFVDKLKEDDHLIIHSGQKNLDEISKKENTNIHSIDDFDIEVGVPGNHNKENARLAYEVAVILGCKDEDIRKSLKEFSGTWRRFEHKGETKNGAIVYDDYAHHPEEVRATIEAAREKFGDKKIMVVFQPHLYSRTKIFLDDFAEVLSSADEVLVLPIYAARESEDGSIDSGMLVEKIGEKAKLFKDPEGVKEYISKNTDGDDIIFTIGAGDVTLISNDIVKS
ncbi:MAG: UDP-N-acetylmuramate--alanine ligase [Candidatus Paceibacteria bacterium]|jgi:UDP-N-acetylmuramate--alanine ligase